MTSLSRQEARALAVDLPWPHKDLSPNARVHHMARHRETQKARRLAGWTARAAGFPKVSQGQILVTATFSPPTRGRYDDDNLIARCKPYFDGLSDAIGLDDQYFKYAPVARAPVRPLGNVRLEIEVLA